MSAFLPEFGLLLLIAAFISAVLQAAGKLRRDWLPAALLAAALVVLILLRLLDDFSVWNVAQHSSRTLPVLYKIVGAWGNHEGSMLLFVLVIAGFGYALARSGQGLAARVQAGLLALILSFVLFTSQPFERVFPPLENGSELNPLLQDVGLALHPPLLYVGYVGFSAVFSLAVAALLQRRIDAAWMHVALQCARAAWSSLTLGIVLGSWWAYRELGWGGYWFWDPVENASLLPWLSGTALLHSLVMLKKRGMLAQWVLVLAILTFAMSLLGTFLVRSGAVTSVHTFAADPSRGMFILALLVLTVGGALTLFALRSGNITNGTAPQPFSREGMVVINNVLFMVMLATVLLGTLYPMAAEWWGVQVSVGAPFFNITFLPVAAIGVLLGFWMIVTGWRMRGQWPLRFAHSGAGVLAVGVICMAVWQVQVEALAKPGDVVSVGPYRFTVAKEHEGVGPNYTRRALRLEMQEGLGALVPEHRVYQGGAQTSEAAIASRLWGDIYATIGEKALQGGTPLHIYMNPGIHAVWLGAVLMAAGGMLAFSRARRRR